MGALVAVYSERDLTDSKLKLRFEYFPESRLMIRLRTKCLNVSELITFMLNG